MSVAGSVLVVLQAGGAGSTWHRISLEALAAGQELASALGVPCDAAVLGSAAETERLAGEFPGRKLGALHAVQHDLLSRYTADGWTSSLGQLIHERKPAFVVLPHTYQVRDFAPALAARLGQAFVSDVIALRVESGVPVFTRQWMQGKVNAEVRPSASGPCFVSVQAGSFRANAIQPAAEPPSTEPFTPQLVPADIRTEPGEPFREAAQAVDLTAAPAIVSVGRGIGEQDNLPLVEELASALGAELAASRPICDAGWLPMERQVGSSGQTVSPKLYLAVGISGAIQHLVGMKGARTVVAINRDPAAPIFEVADIGIVGDLFEIVPALTRKLKE
jgi:electron transfer flavoprotein alpha subunit